MATSSSTFVVRSTLPFTPCANFSLNIGMLVINNRAIFNVYTRFRIGSETITDDRVSSRCRLNVEKVSYDARNRYIDERIARRALEYFRHPLYVRTYCYTSFSCTNLRYSAILSIPTDDYSNLTVCNLLLSSLT